MSTTQQSVQALGAFMTVSQCARPVELYLRQLGQPPASRDLAPPLSLRPVDTFLLHQLAAMLPTPPDVIDLAADATGGASAALWSAHPAVRAVWAPRRSADAAWRGRFDDLTRALPPRARVHLDGPPLVLPSDWGALGAAVGPSAAVLVLVAGADGADAASVLAGALAEFPGAVVAVAGVGATGEDGALEALLAFRRDRPHYRLRALRELSPFLADSDLAVVHAADDAAAPAALDRIAQAFEGNFQFINLVHAVTAAALRDAAGPGDAAPRDRRQGAARPAEQDYPRLVERVRAAVRDAVPAGASVLVVAKGDDQLLRMEGVAASHFPQTDDGTYAGQHPADDSAAVAHLEALRAKGARYLVFPATSVWWLEHYDGFRRHLETTAAVTVCRPDTCIVFALEGRAAPAATKRAAPPPIPYPRLVEQVRQVVAKDVPPDATVAVVSKGDSQLIDLPGRRGVHFPQTPDGVYAGHHPADSAAAVAQLESARRRGAAYLLFPATAFWWLDHYADFRNHLDEHHRRMRDDETCVLYRLSGGGGRRSGGSWVDALARALDGWGRRLRGGNTR